MPHAPIRRADVHAQVLQQQRPRIRDGLESLELALARRDLAQQLLLRRFLRLDDLREVLDEVIVDDGVEGNIQLVGLVAAGGLAPPRMVQNDSESLSSSLDLVHSF